MCTVFESSWIAAESDIIAYKAVRYVDGNWYSALQPSERDSQFGGQYGTVVEYVKGEVMEDNSAFGFYLFPNSADAKSAAAWYHNSDKAIRSTSDCDHEVGIYVVLRVRIPAGTEIRHGRLFWNERTINAKSIEVMGLCA